MRRSVGILVPLGAFAITAGASAQGPAVSPADLNKLVQERRDKEEAEQARWRSTLNWSDWASSGGLRLRAGLPSKIQIGVIFDVALEIESIPAEAVAGHGWLYGKGDPRTTLRLLDSHAAEVARVREYTLEDTDHPGPPPLRLFEHWFDLTQPNHSFLRNQIVVPAVLDAVKPGEANASIRFARSAHSVKGGDEWIGIINTPPVSMTIGPVSFETAEALLPKQLRLVRRAMAGRNDGSSMILVTYTKQDAERVTLTYPKGANLYWRSSCRDSRGLPGATGGIRGGVPEPEDVNGIDQWRRIDASKPIEKTYDLSLVYTLPAPRNIGPEGSGFGKLWARTLIVKYDPKAPPR